MSSSPSSPREAPLCATAIAAASEPVTTAAADPRLAAAADLHAAYSALSSRYEKLDADHKHFIESRSAAHKKYMIIVAGYKEQQIRVLEHLEDTRWSAEQVDAFDTGTFSERFPVLMSSWDRIQPEDGESWSVQVAKLQAQLETARGDLSVSHFANKGLAEQVAKCSSGVGNMPPHTPNSATKRGLWDAVDNAQASRVQHAV